MDQKIDNYWIRIKSMVDCVDESTKTYQTAILRYEGAPKTDPTAPVEYEYPLDIDPSMVFIKCLKIHFHIRF